ncbi:hypothetical protein [Streptomyces sp. NPDC051109]|uniref:hypothetical protein n=1 Tax=Streptomyces sp. NPDC051109 TaxID=3365642 RepID=UPI003794C07F
MTVNVTGTEVKLTPEGATAIDTAFGEKVFKVGDTLFDGVCTHDRLAAHEPGSTYQLPLESII